MRAYIKAGTSLARSVLSAIYSDSQGETTSMEPWLLDADAEANAPLYDLQGRRVTHPRKGTLYIRNGKKVVY